jgi:hypothetical protein
MEFKDAIEGLCSTVTHQEVADALGVSRATVRQAMLAEGARARRRPPEGWEATVGRLAKAQAARLEKLAKRLKA